MKFAKYFVLGLFLTSTAHAYLSIGESGEVLPQNKYQLGIEPQLITSGSTGGNIDVFFDAPINEATSARILLGGGTIDFNAFASVKWMPFPDVDKQPAMGLRFGFGVARDEDENILQLQVAPLVSKKFDTEYGLSVPYLAVPFTFLNTKEENYVDPFLCSGEVYVYAP